VSEPELSVAQLTLAAGDSASLKVSGNSGTVTWSSSDTGVVRVNGTGSGSSTQINARKAGTAVITAKVDGQRLTCTVTIVRPQQEQAAPGTYVLNKNTKKFHVLSCSSVRRMAEKNKEYSDRSRSELIEEGFSPCKICKP